jgi:hypothetical protein
MNIIEALMKHDLRITSFENKRWMVVQKDRSFTVWERPAYKKRATIVISTFEEEDAVRCLLGS